MDAEDDGYCDVADRPLPEPPCGLQRPCPVHEVAEPPRFAFMYDGQLTAGDLPGWVALWEADYFVNDRPPSFDVISWDGEGDPVRRKIEVTRFRAPDDHIAYTFSLPGFDYAVTVLVDGLA